MAKNTKKSGKRPVLGTPAAENQPKARVGKATLVATLVRAIILLHAIATNAAIRAALIPFGYTMVIQRTAWDLATAASGMKELRPTATTCARVSRSSRSTGATKTSSAWCARR
jgi:hypothetical protein